MSFAGQPTNTPPTANLKASPTSGNAPLNVTFDGTGSFDPDFGDTIASYTFKFGDGSPDVTQGSPVGQSLLHQRGNLRSAIDRDRLTWSTEHKYGRASDYRNAGGDAHTYTYSGRNTYTYSYSSGNSYSNANANAYPEPATHASEHPAGKHFRPCLCSSWR